MCVCVWERSPPCSKALIVGFLNRARACQWETTFLMQSICLSPPLTLTRCLFLPFPLLFFLHLPQSYSLTSCLCISLCLHCAFCLSPSQPCLFSRWKKAQDMNNIKKKTISKREESIAQTESVLCVCCRVAKKECRGLTQVREYERCYKQQTRSKAT